MEKRQQYYRCQTCGTMCYGLIALRDHPCNTQVFRTIAEQDFVFGQSTTVRNDMGNVAICDKCGDVYKSEAMGHVLFHYNQEKQALEMTLCPKHSEELYDWGTESQVDKVRTEAFDPEKRAASQQLELTHKAMGNDG